MAMFGWARASALLRVGNLTQIMPLLEDLLMRAEHVGREAAKERLRALPPLAMLESILSCYSHVCFRTRRHWRCG